MFVHCLPAGTVTRRGDPAANRVPATALPLPPSSSSSWMQEPVAENDDETWSDPFASYGSFTKHRKSGTEHQILVYDKSRPGADYDIVQQATVTDMRHE
eukprot:9816675-Heterocapsa_arctica.AAC.1